MEEGVNEISSKRCVTEEEVEEVEEALLVRVTDAPDELLATFVRALETQLGTLVEVTELDEFEL